MLPSGIIEFLSIRPDSDPIWWTIAKLIAWTAIIVLVIIKSTDKVNTGTQALRRRGGKVVTYKWGPKKGEPKVYNPGQQLMIPFWHSMWPTSIQARLLELRNQEYRRPDGHFMAVTVAIQFRVVDIAKALINNESVDALVSALCEKHVLKLLSAGTPIEEIDAVFLAHKPVKKASKKLGVKLIELSIVSAAETSSSQLASMLVAGGLDDPKDAAVLKQGEVKTRWPKLSVIDS